MSKFKNGYTVTLADGTTEEYSRKDRAMKAGEESGQAFTITSSTGKVVHDTAAPAEPAPAPAEPAPKAAKAPKTKVVKNAPARAAAERDGKVVKYLGAKLFSAQVLAGVASDGVTVDPKAHTATGRTVAAAKAVEQMWNDAYAAFRAWKKDTKDQRHTWYQSNDGKREMLVAERQFFTDWFAKNDVL